MRQRTELGPATVLPLVAGRGDYTVRIRRHVIRAAFMFHDETWLAALDHRLETRARARKAEEGRRR